MKNVLKMLLIIAVFVSCQEKHIDKNVSLIPKPRKITFGDSYLETGTSVSIKSAEELQKQAGYLSGILPEEWAVTAPKDAGLTIELQIDKTLKVNGQEADESYKLQIDDDKITITGRTKAGVIDGINTLHQLLLTAPRVGGKKRLPELTIEDYPRFAYRGMHLDVGRHFFPPEFIKKYLDIMALYKFNKFHWHLTEDQGWRIEIKKYPKLTEVGSIRKETLIGHGGRKRSEYTYDGKAYGGYYTQAEIKDIVAYAQERGITVIPEIEMPGHSLAALASYPELGCTGGPYEVATHWGVFEDIYCTKESTFDFLENVLTEVMNMFPSQYIHIGGDEAPKTRWKECPACQRRIKEEGLKDEHELQSYFIRRIEKFLNRHGRSIIGWDEILEGGLAPNATVMSWRGTEGGIEAAKQGHDVIMTPGETCYFDHYQSKNKNEPLAIGGYLPLEKVYRYEPVPESLNAVEAQHILGAQGNVWTEYMPDSKQVEYMILPRMAALAEVDWTDKKKKDYADFSKRVKEHFKMYRKLGYNYCDH